MKRALGVSIAALLLLPLAVEGGQQPDGLTFHTTLESIKMNAQPGQVITRQFRLTLDPNQRSSRFHARMEDWWRSEDGQQSHFSPAGTLQRSCAEWVSLNPVESALQPGETLTVRLSVTIPREVSAGGFWCVLTVDEVPDPLTLPPDTVAVQFTASVSTGVFIYLDPVQRAATVRSIVVEGDHVRIGVRNDGNSPLGIEGHAQFFVGDSDTPVTTVELPRTTVLTEPSRNGMLSAPLRSSSDLPDGMYRVRVLLDYGEDHYIGAERQVDVSRPDDRSREPAR